MCNHTQQLVSFYVTIYTVYASPSHLVPAKTNQTDPCVPVLDI